MENFLSIKDFDRNELEKILEKTEDVKSDPESYRDSLTGRSVLMLFEESSTRTRVSFEAGIHELGGDSIFLSFGDSQISRGESIKDTAKTVSRYVDAVIIRTSSHETLTRFEEHAEVPVINGLTDRYHPCQALSDVYTLREKGVEGSLTYIGDGNNVANSLIHAADMFGFELRVATPEEAQTRADVVEESGENVELLNDPYRAVENAKAVYTDVWQSMGEEKKDLSRFEEFSVDSELMENSDDAFFMHCLPAHRGEEVTADVIDGDRSIIYEQAENRKHIQKSLLMHLLGDL